MRAVLVMAREEFELQLLEDIMTGFVSASPYRYIEENLSILREYKDYFRQYFINNPECAYWYARCVDECSRQDTRRSACKCPSAAYYYAADIDKCEGAETFKGVKGSKWEEYYKDLFVFDHDFFYYGGLVGEDD